MNKTSRRAGKKPSYLFLAAAAILVMSFLSTPSDAARKPNPIPSPVTSAPDATTWAPITATFATNARSFSLADSSRLNLFYDSLNLDNLGLSQAAWHSALNGFLNLVASGQIRNPAILSIIDFSLPSSQKRLFIIDMFNGRLLFNSLVAHGKNSGKLLAERFSNRYNSFMSSLGFYLTGDPFIGQHGYSLRLEGIDPGWNDNAHGRSIIIHSAPYVSEQHVRQWGFLGRSEGCPAIPRALDRPIIESIRGGSCIFAYSPLYSKSPVR